MLNNNGLLSLAVYAMEAMEHPFQTLAEIPSVVHEVANDFHWIYWEDNFGHFFAEDIRAVWEGKMTVGHLFYYIFCWMHGIFGNMCYTVEEFYGIDAWCAEGICILGLFGLGYVSAIILGDLATQLNKAAVRALRHIYFAEKKILNRLEKARKEALKELKEELAENIREIRAFLEGPSFDWLRSSTAAWLRRRAYALEQVAAKREAAKS